MQGSTDPLRAALREHTLRDTRDATFRGDVRSQQAKRNKQGDMNMKHTHPLSVVCGLLLRAGVSLFGITPVASACRVTGIELSLSVEKGRADTRCSVQKRARASHASSAPASEVTPGADSLPEKQLKQRKPPPCCGRGEDRQTLVHGSKPTSDLQPEPEGSLRMHEGRSTTLIRACFFCMCLYAGVSPGLIAETSAPTPCGCPIETKVPVVSAAP